MTHTVIFHNHSESRSEAIISISHFRFCHLFHFLTSDSIPSFFWHHALPQSKVNLAQVYHILNEYHQLCLLKGGKGCCWWWWWYGPERHAIWLVLSKAPVLEAKSIWMKSFTVGTLTEFYEDFPLAGVVLNALLRWGRCATDTATGCFGGAGFAPGSPLGHLPFPCHTGVTL